MLAMGHPAAAVLFVYLIVGLTVGALLRAEQR